jgi:hypothetical protein
VGRHPHHVCSRIGGSGRYRALRCHRVALRTRLQVRALPDLQERTLALRAAPPCDRSSLPSHVCRPHARSEDAAVTGAFAPRASQARAGGPPRTTCCRAARSAPKILWWSGTAYRMLVTLSYATHSTQLRPPRAPWAAWINPIRVQIRVQTSKPEPGGHLRGTCVTSRTWMRHWAAIPPSGVVT